MKKITKKIGLFIMIFSMALGVFGAGCKKEESKETVNNPKDEATAIVNNKEKKYGDTKGFLWEVKKGKATVYMLGSIHVGDETMYPMHKVVEDAFNSSDVVVGEIDITNTEAVIKQAAMMMYANGETALDHLSAEGKGKMDKVCAELGLDSKVLLTQKVWVLGSVLSELQMNKAGYDANYGIDMHFLNRAKESNKKIAELEGAEFQFNMLNSFSDKEQEDNFVLSLSTLEETKEALDELFNSYKSGNEEEVIKVLGIEDKSSNYYKKMILDRNIGMTAKIEEYLSTEDTYFVVAGLAHFIGDDGIIKMLADKGYAVTRK